MDLKIECRNMEMDAELQEEVERINTRLHDHHPQLMHSRVVLTRNVRHRNGVQACEVLAFVRLPRHRMFTARKSASVFGEAIRAVIEALDVEITTFRDKRSDRRALVPAREPQSDSQEVA